MKQRIKYKLLVASFALGQFLFYSCRLPHDREIICEQNFKMASDLAYSNPTNKASLDSSLTLVNRCMQCDSIKTAVVEFKIHLLITLGKFKEGFDFLNSLEVSDFIYPYKRKFNKDNFIALNFASTKDTISRDMTYRNMVTDLERYISSNTLKSKEFQEAFTDLNALTENLNNSSVSKRQIDFQKLKYPGEAKFLDFFKH
jgi:hypothetical protein